MMNWRLLLAAMACVVSAFAGYSEWQGSTRRPAGPVEGSPVQEDLTDASAFQHDGKSLIPKAKYTIQAKLLSKRRYRFSADGSTIPWDFAMGWGPMARDQALDALKISQSDRFYFYAWKGDPPMPVADIVTHSANMHLIPANKSVMRDLDRAQPGDAITLRGRLVDMTDTQGRVWKTSVTREDSGPGACELMWVESVEIARN